VIEETGDNHLSEQCVVRIEEMKMATRDEEKRTKRGEARGVSE
jgi:hypothetical protein